MGIGLALMVQMMLRSLTDGWTIISHAQGRSV